jgi:hypothetical protein
MRRPLDGSRDERRPRDRLLTTDRARADVLAPPVLPRVVDEVRGGIQRGQPEPLGYILNATRQGVGAVGRELAHRLIDTVGATLDGGYDASGRCIANGTERGFHSWPRRRRARC